VMMSTEILSVEKSTTERRSSPKTMAICIGN
jgi:hypothetical protein